MSLEADSQSELHLTWVVALGIENAPTSSRGYVECRIAKLHVVQNIQEEELEFGAYPFRDPEVLSHAEVHIPVRQATNWSRTAIPGIDTQDGVVGLIEHCHRIREYVDAYRNTG